MTTITVEDPQGNIIHFQEVEDMDRPGHSDICGSYPAQEYYKWYTETESWETTPYLGVVFMEEETGHELYAIEYEGEDGVRLSRIPKKN
jgi:hypothetical protein